LSKADELSGRVCGSYGNEYTAALQLSYTLDQIHRTDCSCQTDRQCQHTVAVVLFYLNEVAERERQWEEFSYERSEIESLIVHEARDTAAGYLTNDESVET